MDRALRVTFCLPLLLLPVEAAEDFVPSTLRLETKTIPGGAELVTVFNKSSSLAKEVPLVTVLRDTLGDSNSANDRLRYVWVHTFASPSFPRRAAAAVPFLYSRIGSGISKPSTHPVALHDLSSEKDRAWLQLSKFALQSLVLDGQGAVVRSATRSYSFNISEYQAMYTMQALALLARIDPAMPNGFNSEEIDQVGARLALAESRLGGLVSNQSLKRVHQKNVERRADARGRNWEILRQRAEMNGLYFQPLALPGESPSQAILWIEPEDAERKPAKWDGKFLHISNPWTDSRIRNWKGYEETRRFDSAGFPVEPNAGMGRPRRLVPLSVYSLDHRKVPLLLVNFRNAFQPRRREYQDRITKDIVSGILGLSRFADWEFFTASATWDFVSGRWGASNSLNDRLNAWSQFRQFLTLDTSLDPKLRDILKAKSDRNSANPLESKVDGETALARRQYENLIAYSNDPKGLAKKLDKDRRAEFSRYSHSARGLAVHQFVHVATLGLYTHRESGGKDITARLSDYREVEKYMEFLETALEESPQLEVDYELDELERAAVVLASAKPDQRITKVLERMSERTLSEKLRGICLVAIHRTPAQVAGGQ